MLQITSPDGIHHYYVVDTIPANEKDKWFESDRSKWISLLSLSIDFEYVPVSNKYDVIALMKPSNHLWFETKNFN